MAQKAQLIFIFFLALFTSLAKAQLQSPLDTLTKKFQNYQSTVVQEKLYVHTDRTNYLAGELLWFKIYSVDAHFHKLLNVSRVAYVEILDKNNHAIVQTKVELFNGLGQGSLFIPAVIENGLYVFRVYTNWMKNFSPDFYFHQSITILNTFIKSEPEIEKPAISAKFFPEGGHVLADVETKIAFQVTGHDGMGIPFKGYVFDSSGAIITEFEPLKFGIGHFIFTAKADELYSITIEDKTGNKIDFPFPEIRKSGYSMSVVNNDKYLEINVTARSIDPSVIFLIAHSKQCIVKAEGKFLNNNYAQFKIEKKDLGDGITNLTLFNSEHQPICERLIFKKPEEKLEFNIQSERKDYGPRNLVKLNLTGNKNSNVSISVYRIDSIPAPSRKNIHEYLWLSSDLTGIIESPEYYFNNFDSIATIATDNLMLTHGWRRFNWDAILNPKTTPEFLPEYRGHLIKGKAMNNNTPVSGMLISFSSPDTLIHLYGSRTNAKGEFFFEVKNFYGVRSAYVQPLLQSDNNFEFIIDNPFSTRYAAFDLPRLKLNPALRNDILNRSISMQIHNIYFREKLNLLHKVPLDNIPFYGKADETYMLDNYTRFPLLEEIIKEYVKGAMIRKRKDGIQFMVQKKINQPISTEAPLILLDGVPVFDYEKLLEFEANKVEKLEILTNEYYWGPLVIHGAIMLTTYTGDLNGFEINPKTFSINYEGLQSMREFYSPTYENQPARESRIPDNRSLLYWNPSLSLEAQVSTPIQFYTSDLAGKFEIVVEGISEHGIAGDLIYRFIVDDEN